MNGTFVNTGEDYRRYRPRKPCPKCGFAGEGYAFYCAGEPSDIPGFKNTCDGTDWAGTEHLHVTCGCCHWSRIEPTHDGLTRFEESFPCSDPPSAT